MKNLLTPALSQTNFNRRRFVQGLAGSGLALGLPVWAHEGQDHSRPKVEATDTDSAPVLSGTEFDLTVSEIAVNFTGKPGVATAINGSIPAPTLRWKEGQTVTIRVHNRLREYTSIHWHGILLPYQMDGVPGISFAGIAPGESFTYQFTVRQSGTYWYHSHSGMQELTGMYGAIIIEPQDARHEPRAERDFVVQLSDWTDENPMRVLTKLRVQSDLYNYQQPTAQDFARDIRRYGLRQATALRQMWNQMRMSPTDFADVSAAASTYLLNGQPPAANWTGVFQRGERLRLRFINAAGNTFYDVRIPSLKMTVVQADGLAVEPVSVDEFRFGPGETYDVLVQPTDDAHSIFAQSMDRTGYALGTLALRPGLRAPVPALEPAPWLGMADMMGDMGGNMGGGNAHAGHGASNPHATHAGHGSPLARPSSTVRHARSEYGASTDMRVDMPRRNLNDPGIGLRNNGRRVLTLADLHTVGGAPDKRGAEREIELHLTGNMERYSWSLDGLEFGKSSPVHFRHGERLRVILHNDTMMTHPMHLHGMWSDLETEDGVFQVRRHTLPVQPAQRISFLVTADALGRWVWHCHLMFHMDMGMFREVVVS